MKLLLFDFENGGKTVGSQEELAKLFGLPVFEPDSWEATQNVIGQIFKPVSVEREIQIAKGITIKQSKREVIKRDGVEIDAIAFDTFTELVKKYQRSLQNGAAKLSFSKWGEIKTEVDLLMEYLNGFPINVICNVHAKTEKDEDSGIIELVPNIEGSSRYDISKWFDFVLYADTIKDENGVIQFIWRTQRDERYSNAKDRSQLLPPQIPQDYKLLLNAAKERGWSSIKVFVIGKPGTGKTKSLTTLV